MSDRKLRWLGLGLVATASAGALGLTATMNPTVAHADGEDIGLVIGASGVPTPGSLYSRPLTTSTSTMGLAASRSTPT
jgi:hypothetical protein